MPRQSGKNLKALNEMISRGGYHWERQSKWNHYVVYKNGKPEFEFFGDQNLAKMFDMIHTSKTIEEGIELIKKSYEYHHLDGSKKTTVKETEVFETGKINNLIDATQMQDVASAKVIPIETKRVEHYADKPVDFNRLTKLGKEYKNFYFPDFKNSLISRIIKGRNIYINGESGCGKSDMIAKMADYVGVNFIRINFHVGISESQLIGKFTVKDSQTKFVYGYIPLAMLHGWWVLLDEIDYAQPENLAILQPILEGNPLVVVQNEGEVITPHPNFRIFANGNTKGRGDESNSYSGTNFLNASFMDRFSVFEMTYTNKEKEIAEKIIGDAELASKLIDLFRIFRNASEKGEIINSVFSTRRLIQVCEALKDGETLMDSLKYEIFTRYNSHETNTLVELTADVFDRNHYFTKWKLGDDHHVIQNQATNNP